MSKPIIMLPRILGVYLLTFVFLAYLKPECMFLPDGSPKSFGTGESETLLPVHHASILAAIFSFQYFKNKGG